MYSVKEIFYTLQGEGAQTGMAAVFCRFAGCNLWSGREEDRSSAICQFCDTNFVGVDGVGGGKFESAEDLAIAIERAWPIGAPSRMVVLTGGEPLLQLDTQLLQALHLREFRVALETNGTIQPPPGIDWVCVSPKAGATLLVTAGDELKVVFPQSGIDPAALRNLSFRHFYLQPMDGPMLQINTRRAVDYCLQHPEWRLSLQTHKTLGIP